MAAIDLVDLLARLARQLRSRTRSGVLSRRPLEITRIELVATPSHASCDWIIRPIDLWDEALAQHDRAMLQSRQVLHDALDMRNMIFRRFPEIATIELRAFRISDEGEQELILAGTVHRGDDVPERIPSLTMRAHLTGFQFQQVDGVLSALPCDSLRYSHKS